MEKPIYEVCIDFDAIDWSDEPDFSEDYDNISGNVDLDGINYVDWKRGKAKEEGNAPAATCQIRLKSGLCLKYSPFSYDDIGAKLRPWLPVRVRTYWNEEYIPCYFGYINKVSIDPHPAVQSVVFYCTDGTDLLARQEIAQDPANKTLMSDGDAIEMILDAAGWSSIRRKIDKDGGSDLVAYPTTYVY